MFSNLNCNTLLPCDIPCLLDTHLDEEAPPQLNFDDLLDIAHEFEFASTITHIWPSEEPSTCPETGLEDIFAVIIPMPNEESPLPQPSATPSIFPGSLQEVDLHESASIHPSPGTNASISKDSVALLPDDDQVQAKAENLSTPMLWGWSPPSGSKFLDLDDNLMFPSSMKDASMSPWLATLLTPSHASISESSTMVHAIGDLPLASGTDPKAQAIQAIRTIDTAVDHPSQKNVSSMPLRAQRTTLEPTRAVNTNISNQTATNPRAKTPKSRVHLSSPFATVVSSTAKYAKAPRGGIPPHIARTVTKANILRIEKERKIIQNTFHDTTLGEGKKPSVLRRVLKAGEECRENGKKLFDQSHVDEKGWRAAKRARA